MSRAEFRRAKRESEQKQRTYILTQEQIDWIKAGAVAESTYKATILMMGIPCLVCRDLFGFGKRRLEKLMAKSMFWLKSVHDGEVTFTEILDVIEKETGYRVEKHPK